MLCKIGLAEDEYSYFTAMKEDLILYAYDNNPIKKEYNYFSDTMRVIFDIPTKNDARLTKEEIELFKDLYV